jgi:cytochrome c-type biogenesis protein CcmH
LTRRGHARAGGRRLGAAGLALAAALALPGAAPAVEADEMLADPALEARARALSKELRCLVCQNQSIDDSDADLARDLRLLVRERIEAGDSDEAVLRFVVERYGDFVLLRPPVKPSTYLLWAMPAILLGGAVLLALAFYRRRGRPAPAGDKPLTADERARLDELLAADHETR